MPNKQTGNIQPKQGSRLNSEVVSLFGRALVEQSKQIRIEQMAIEAELVAEGAKQLREQSGHPDRQRSIIRAMDLETALALCKWIREPGQMAQFIEFGKPCKHKMV
jgi:hypothetical protein